MNINFFSWTLLKLQFTHTILLWTYVGTDDDIPPSQQNRIPRTGRIAGNGRSAIASVPYPGIYGETDMEAQIHHLEQEAYSSVLRAFKAQADAITWVLFKLLSWIWLVSLFDWAF